MPDHQMTPITRMHADEVHTDATLVRGLLAAQFPAWAGLSILRVASSGTDNALYRLGDTMVVRLPRIHWAAAHVAKEYEWLPRLAPDLPVAIPTPLTMGEPAGDYPWHWAVYRWLDGDAAPGAPVDDLGRVAGEVAGFIAALQRIDTAHGLPPARPGERGAPLAARDTVTRQAIAALRGMIDTVAATAAWETALHAPAWSGPPVWVHGDLAASNLLIRDGRLGAIIDFGCLGVGDPAVDLIVAWEYLAPVRDILRAALGVDAATWLRGRGWALSTALVALPYYLDTNPGLVNSARQRIATVLADYAQCG